MKRVIQNNALYLAYGALDVAISTEVEVGQLVCEALKKGSLEESVMVKSAIRGAAAGLSRPSPGAGVWWVQTLA